MPKMVKTVLTIFATLVAAGIWGFGGVLMGVPNVLIGIGAAVIGMIIFVFAFGKDSE